MTDEEIRGIIRWQYRGNHDGPMAEIIFNIACIVRDRLQTWTESEVVRNLRDRLKMEESSKKSAWSAYETVKDQNVWRERYHQLHKIHCEDVRRRKEMRRFRAANFSTAELKRELERRQEPIEPVTWVPIEDGDYNTIAKASHVWIEDDGREVNISMRNRQSTRKEFMQLYSEVRICMKIEKS